MLKIERTSNAVLTVRVDDIDAGWEGWFLLRSDAHHDSKKCNRALEEDHLKAVMEREGWWADFGDLFDAMQGRYDPRRQYADIRNEDVGDSYYDLLVQHAFEFYGPYAERCLMLGKGNHETATLKHASTDLTSNLVHRLNVEALKDSDHRIQAGCFGGWIRFMFRFNKTKARTVYLKYKHGGGYRAPVTKGVIETARQAVYLPDANIVVNGHNHQNYILTLARERLTRKGKPYKDLQWHGRIPGYMDDYGDGTEGWAIEKGHEPTAKGAIWLHFKCHNHKIQYKLVPEFS